MSENIERSLGRIEGLLTKLDKNFDDHIKADTDRFEKNDVRLKSLENSRAWTVGLGAGVSALIAAVYHVFKG